MIRAITRLLFAFLFTAPGAALAAGPGAAPTADATALQGAPHSPSANQLLAQARGPSASPTLDAPAAEAPGAPGLGGLLGVGLVLAIAGAAAMIAHRRRRGPSAPGPIEPAALRHIKSLRLGPKHQIAMIEAGGRTLVVGVTASQMTLLTELDPSPSAAKAPRPQDERGEERPWSSVFAEELAARRGAHDGLFSSARPTPARAEPEPAPPSLRPALPEREPAPRARRSAESDSMLIALAEMRAEASR